MNNHFSALRVTFAIASIILISGIASCTSEDELDGNTQTPTDTISQGGDTPIDSTYYTLKVCPNHDEWGVANGSGRYLNGSIVEIEAVPHPGYYFIRWSDGEESNPRSVTISRMVQNPRVFAYALFSDSPNDHHPHNPEEWVDLDLPSGLLWARCNIGATTPDEGGNLFAWGETHSKDSYFQDNYAHMRFSNPTWNYKLTKYCQDPADGYNRFTDSLTILQACDDVATAVLGKEYYRIPTDEEWQELINYTSQRVASLSLSDHGLSGVMLTGHSNYLFLPFKDASTGGSGYWSSVKGKNDSRTAYAIFLRSDTPYCSLGYTNREYGLPVRAVCTLLKN